MCLVSCFVAGYLRFFLIIFYFCHLIFVCRFIFSSSINMFCVFG